ncbi:hypothetical protein D9M73_112520 [compost metagenome]
MIDKHVAKRGDRNGTARRQFILRALKQTAVAGNRAGQARTDARDDLARPGEGITVEGPVDRNRRCIDGQRPGVAPFVIGCLGTRALAGGVEMGGEHPEAGLDIGIPLDHADIDVVGIGLANVDDAAVGSDQLAGLDRAGGIIDPAAGNVDRRARRDMDVRGLGGIGLIGG